MIRSRALIAVVGVLFAMCYLAGCSCSPGQGATVTLSPDEVKAHNAKKDAHEGK